MKKGFIPVILIAVLALVIAVGGVGIGLAWKTNVLDKWLPPNIKEMFGRGEKPEEKPEEEPEEKPGGELTKDWKVYRNEKASYQVKIPQDWEINELEDPGPGVPVFGYVTFLFPGYDESEAAFHIDIEFGVGSEIYSSLSESECKDFPGLLKSLPCPLASGLLETLPKIDSRPLNFSGDPSFLRWTAYASLPCEFSSDINSLGDALRTYSFSIRHPQGYAEAEKILKQILSTFKFIK